MFWLSGVVLALIGLVFLIINVCFAENLPDFEKLGMAFLTVCPILNMFAKVLLESDKYSSKLKSRSWLSSEVFELFGMLLLDSSYIDVGRNVAIILEVFGFFVLALAAVLEVKYDIEEDSKFWFDFHLDYIRLSDSFGLFLLALVAIAKFQMHSSTSIPSDAIKENTIESFSVLHEPSSHAHISTVGMPSKRNEKYYRLTHKNALGNNNTNICPSPKSSHFHHR